MLINIDRICGLKKKRKRLLDTLPPLASILRSTISAKYLTCGYKRCKCHKGEKHGPFVYLSVKDKGKLKTYFVPKELEKDVIAGVENYSKLWDKLCKISQINREILWLKKVK